MSAHAELSAQHVLEYPYQRSTGPVIGRFLTGLRDRRVLGIRARDGRVLVPPQEYDPLTSEALDEWVEVADSGVVTTWTWQGEPRSTQPLSRPFAWVLVRLDGADTSLLHALDVDDRASVRTGMRVRIRWADEPTGSVVDIACFEPEPPT
ncbi:MAG: OB-fold domain-containing protein [Actinobacteria bacterium]|nr:OB-fold domain-containing protein [Actinomycetota bacterium]